ncbi:NAD-dependent epimerase/dehydratase family protein [Staphylococcus equorum]|uniref:NAD-dependent epimerase/dehydratase family protein n=1 Tax=Staphylococcus equorum TaxID=246432 RepID=UPI000E6769D9|nr:NAD-dependent epimerase/dehydratase family protein [Staphylococcus equorum]MDK9844537.1 NAD-dependent epimerase/dehydratase family protein [Staphylococcus equorum]MDK9860157.1 NAD-dependent epimerase/dehydratase family protein [Staphylococcus equorum]RIL33665.1 NAD-dependent epimerase/dehydratase family protein [Staphylococcus equorum]
MKILITGANGHSGKIFLNNIENNRKNIYEEIHVVVRNSSLDDFIERSPLNIIKHVGDIKDSDFVENITKDIDVILHIAGIQMSELIFYKAIENNINWIISIHTTGRYSKFKSASAEYIDIEDKLLKLRDKINITILRPTMIYGSSRDRNMNKLIKFIDRFPIYPIFGNGNNLMQPVNAKDLAIAYQQVIENSEITINENYNLSGKYPIKYKNLISTVSQHLNKKTVLVKLPIIFSRFFVRICRKLVPKFPLNEEQVLRMKEDKDFTHLKATKDFGYNPMSFEEGIVEEIKEYKRKFN